MTQEQRISIACDADLRANTAIGRKIASELQTGDAMDLEHDIILDMEEEDEYPDLDITV